MIDSVVNSEPVTFSRYTLIYNVFSIVNIYKL